MEVTIIFADGKTVSAVQNGDCFITKKKPAFPEDLSEVTIRADGEEDKVLTDVVITEVASVDNKYWFAFTKEDPVQKAIRELQQDTAEALNGLLEFVLGEEEEE